MVHYSAIHTQNTGHLETEHGSVLYKKHVTASILFIYITLLQILVIVIHQLQRYKPALVLRVQCDTLSDFIPIPTKVLMLFMQLDIQMG